MKYSSQEFRNNVSKRLSYSEKIIYSKLLIEQKLRIFLSKRFITNKFPYEAESQYKLREGGGLSGNYQWLRLRELYNLIVQNRIDSVLELGSGGSTVFLEGLNIRRLDTFEESQKWLERTKSVLRGNKNCEIYHSPREISEKDSKWHSYYREPTPLEIYDKFHHKMIYIDGPSAKFNDGNKDLMSINSDAGLILEQKNLPKLIVIDGRPETTEYYANKFKDRYQVTIRTAYKSWDKRKGEYNYHSYLKLKE